MASKNAPQILFDEISSLAAAKDENCHQYGWSLTNNSRATWNIVISLIFSNFCLEISHPKKNCFAWVHFDTQIVCSGITKNVFICQSLIWHAAISLIFGFFYLRPSCLKRKYLMCMSFDNQLIECVITKRATAAWKRPGFMGSGHFCFCTLCRQICGSS